MSDVGSTQTAAMPRSRNTLNNHKIKTVKFFFLSANVGGKALHGLVPVPRRTSFLNLLPLSAAKRFLSPTLTPTSDTQDHLRHSA